MDKKQKRNIKKQESAITLIALVVTIVVLLILAAVSISMLTGDNGIIKKASDAKDKTEQAKVEELVTIAINSLITEHQGDRSKITPDDIAKEVNNMENREDVEAEDSTFPTNILFPKEDREVGVNIDLAVTDPIEQEIYSVPVEESQIAPDDLFDYEIISNSKMASIKTSKLTTKKARIIGIKSQYCNGGGYNSITDSNSFTDTNYEIIYKGEKISDTLVIPHQVEIEGEMYRITEVNLYAYGIRGGFGSCFPRVETIIFPNTIEKIDGPNALWHYGETNYNTLKKVVLPSKLKTIGDGVFWGCSNLSDITIPDSIISIGTNVFYDTAWYNNQSDGDLYLGKVYYKYKGTMPTGTSITIKEGTTMIASKAFYNCTGMTNITVPDSVMAIGTDAFSRTTWYNNQPNGDLYIGKVYYKYKGTMPTGTNIAVTEGTTMIVSNAFDTCTSLASITIPNSVTSIGSYTFKGCTGLTSIGTYAFYSCTGLKSITIPNSVTNIGMYAFGNCTGLTNITIPNRITKIERGLFYGCSALTNVTIPNSVTSIGGDAFDNCIRLKSITIPNSVIGIGSDAFYNCIGLKSIIIQDSVISIGDRTFKGCTGLTSIEIPNSVTQIGDNAFSSCYNLKTITIIRYLGNTTQISGQPWGATNAKVEYVEIRDPDEYEKFAINYVANKSKKELEELVLKSIPYAGTFEEFLTENNTTRTEWEQQASEQNMSYEEFLRDSLINQNIGDIPWLGVEYETSLQGGNEKTTEELENLFVQKIGLTGTFDDFLAQEEITREQFIEVIKNEGFRTEEDFLKYIIYFE